MLKQSFAVSGKRLQAWGFRVLSNFNTHILNFSVLCSARGAQGSSGSRRPVIVAVAIVAVAAGAA